MESEVKMLQRTKRVLALLLAIATVWTGMPVSTVQAQELNQEESVLQKKEAVQEAAEENTSEGTALEETIPKEEVTEEETTPKEEETKEETISEEKPTEVVQEKSVQEAQINYAVVDNAYITAPGTQKIVVGVGADDTIVESAVLTYVNEETQERFSVPMSQAIGGAVLFSIDFAEGQSGVYAVESLEYTVGGVTYTGNFNASGMETKFGVDREIETVPDAVIADEEEITSDIVTFDENGNASSQNSIEEAIGEAEGVVGKNAKGATGNVVVVLDPGHDNSHAGAHQSGLKEEELNLKIAKYCKAELEQYAGVTVYLTRPENGSCPYPGTSSADCNAGRVAYAKSVGANVYVSLHLNSNGSSSPNGAEIYYPNGNYNSSIGTAGGQLADSILNKLGALGLNVRGKKIRNSEDNTTYPDGSLADYYGVIRRSKLEGIPAIIVEHAFMTNAGDVNTYLNNEAGLKQLGVADAAGIAEYFGLSKGNSLHLNGVFYTEKKDCIEAGVTYKTTAKFVAFRWLAYNVNKGTWTTVSDWSASDYITWKPESGPYWLRVEAVTDQGVEKDWTIEYTSKKDYTRHYVDINGIYYIEGKDGISAGAVHTTDDSATEFRWLEYNVSKGTWKIVSDWAKNENVVWRPGSGKYWLRAEARTSDGITAENAIVYNSTKDYLNSSYVNLNGIFYIEGNNEISAAVSYDTNNAKTQFRWMSYNVNKGTWSILSDWSKKESVEWKPEAGPHWLRVDARTGDGVQKEYALVYNSVRDYNYNYINIQGIYYTENVDGIRAGAVHNTNDSNVEFRWLVYDADRGNWSTLSDWKKTEWVTWKPEAGNYWLRVEGRTSDGRESNCTITYKMDKYEIMGSSNVTLSQMVAYYNSRAGYPVFYQNTDAPTIQAFCQIYLEECAAEGVKAEVAFSQAMKETGYLKFGGTVNISQFNFAGIGATDSGGTPASFSDVRTGVRAQIQHLKAYASTSGLNNGCVDPRFHLVKRGTAPYVEWLGQKENPAGYGWATAQNYGYSIKNDYMYKLMSY